MDLITKHFSLPSTPIAIHAQKSQLLNINWRLLSVDRMELNFAVQCVIVQSGSGAQYWKLFLLQIMKQKQKIQLKLPLCNWIVKFIFPLLVETEMFSIFNLERKYCLDKEKAGQGKGNE